jgi:hypothetical protein
MSESEKNSLRHLKWFIPTLLSILLLAGWAMSVRFTEGVLQACLVVVPSVLLVMGAVAALCYFISKAQLPIPGTSFVVEHGRGRFRVQPSGEALPEDWPARKPVLVADMTHALNAPLSKLRDFTLKGDVEVRDARLKERESEVEQLRKAQQTADKAHATELETLRGKIKELTERPASSSDAVANLETIRRRAAELEQKNQELNQQLRQAPKRNSRNPQLECAYEGCPVATSNGGNGDYSKRDICYVPINKDDDVHAAGGRLRIVMVPACKGPQCERELLKDLDAAPKKRPDVQTKKPVTTSGGT